MCAPTRARAALGRLLLCAGALMLAGCATLRSTLSAYDTGADGLARPQERLREILARGDFKAALAWHEEDELLRRLDVGIATYYAAQFARSATVLDSAALLADDRITASLSKDGMAMLTSDLARPYQPGRTERLFIPYYAMLAYARLEQWEDAAVEARRLSALLAQYADDRDDRERALHGALHALAGAVFERAGERGDAEVAARAARALEPAFASDSAPRATDGTTGDVLVVVERGFVAHRVTEALELDLEGADDDPLRVRDASQRDGHRSAQAMGASVSSTFTYARVRHQRVRHDDDEDSHLTIALPALRRSTRPWGARVRAVSEADTAGRAGVVVAVDEGSAADERRERRAIVARAAARAAAKYAVVKAVRDRKGEVAGTLANIGASLLERADVRSWHLLPGELTLIRLHLPAGPQRITLCIGEGSRASTVEIGTVRVRAGSVVLAPVRLWQAPPTPVAMPDTLQPNP